MGAFPILLSPCTTDGRLPLMRMGPTNRGSSALWSHKANSACVNGWSLGRGVTMSGPSSPDGPGKASSATRSCLAIKLSIAKDNLALNSPMALRRGHPCKSPAQAFSTLASSAVPLGPTPAQACQAMGENSQPLPVHRCRISASLASSACFRVLPGSPPPHASLGPSAMNY